MLLLGNLLKLCLRLIVLIKLINCETVHFTNSPSYLVQKKNYTTYKLDVPGSNSITIIEANTPAVIQRNVDDNNSNIRSHIIETEIKNDSSNNNRNYNTKTVYAPSLLEKFMNEYNIKVSTNINNADTVERTLVKRGYDDYLELDDNKHDSSHHYQQRPQPQSNADKRNPFNEKEGWVTLQAVPWSKSQVSKWKPKGNVKPLRDNESGSQINRKDNNNNNKWNYGGHGIDRDSSSSNNYPSSRPNFYDHDNDKDFGDNLNYANDDRRQPVRPSLESVPWNTFNNNNNADRRPSYDKPEIEVANNYDRWYDYGFRPDLEDRYEKKPTPSKPMISDNFGENTYNNHNNQHNQHPHHHHHYSDYNYENNDNVAASGSRFSLMRNPLRIPKPYSNNRFTTSETQYSNQLSHHHHHHPLTHPSNGKGEWVLVSTTKGYQHPPPTQSVPRGMQFDQIMNPSNSGTAEISSGSQPTNYRTHKSIKLTVLPAKSEDGRLKPMSFSHGGLLEVESSSQTVEDSATAVLGNKRKLVKRKVNTNNANANPPMKFVQAIPVKNNNKLDRSAVLAAVSAGMVPATMAMLMPVVLGRKKRSLTYQITNNNFDIAAIIKKPHKL